LEYGGAPNAPKFSTMRSGNPHSNALASPFSRDQVFGKGQRKRLNLVAMLIALFVPWLLFCLVNALVSFSLHYTQPFVCNIIVTLAFLGGVGLTTLLAANAMKRKALDPAYQPSWYLFLAGTCFLAFVIGFMSGEWNYENFMQKYYNLQHLSHYQDIDTNVYLGQQLMDAGQINFKKGTGLDLGRSMGFKSHDVYCVAPIVTKNSANKALSMDFWAVGKNCCSGVKADFHCSGFGDPDARGVIRLMHDEDRPFYRLAVQQAEATYKVTATHPLFFEWVHDGQEATDAFSQKGIVYYFLGVCSYFLVQIFLTVVAALSFSKLVHS